MLRKASYHILGVTPRLVARALPPPRNRALEEFQWNWDRAYLCTENPNKSVANQLRGEGRGVGVGDPQAGRMREGRQQSPAVECHSCLDGGVLQMRWGQERGCGAVGRLGCVESQTPFCKLQTRIKPIAYG